MTSKISQVLIASEGVRKQIKSNLVEMDKNGKIIAYCALGALACEKDMFKGKKDVFDCNQHTEYRSIVKAYGTDPFAMVPHPLHGTKMEFTDIIYSLNDGGMSFKEIGEYIKKLEDEGVIKYEN